MDSLTVFGLLAVTAMLVFMPWRTEATGLFWRFLARARGLNSVLEEPDHPVVVDRVEERRREIVSLLKCRRCHRIHFLAS